MGVAKIQPKRAIVTQDTSNLPKDLDELGDVLFRRFFLANLVIDPFRAAFAARRAIGFTMTSYATPASSQARSCKRLGSLPLGKRAMVALRVPTDPSCG